jgi:hypothetical protein
LPTLIAVAVAVLIWWPGLQYNWTIKVPRSHIGLWLNRRQAYDKAGNCYDHFSGSGLSAHLGVKRYTSKDSSSENWTILSVSALGNRFELPILPD